MPEITWRKEGTCWTCPLEGGYELWRSDDGHEIRLRNNGRSVTVDWCQTEYELEKRAEELAKDIRNRMRAKEKDGGLNGI